MLSDRFAAPYVEGEPVEFTAPSLAEKAGDAAQQVWAAVGAAASKVGAAVGAAQAGGKGAGGRSSKGLLIPFLVVLGLLVLWIFRERAKRTHGTMDDTIVRWVGRAVGIGALGMFLALSVLTSLPLIGGGISWLAAKLDVGQGWWWGVTLITMAVGRLWLDGHPTPATTPLYRWGPPLGALAVLFLSFFLT